jgi:hypothetical protein
MRKVFFCLALALAGCVGDKTGADVDSGAIGAGTSDSGSPDRGVDTGDGEPEEDTGTSPYSGPLGFIGSPCSEDEDCGYEGGLCLTEDFPDGMCSASCDQYCPDLDGHPVTFCVDGAGLGAPGLEGGYCVSRCDFEYFSASGCRDAYGCQIEARLGEPWTETFTCLPGDETDLSACHFELADRGIAFEPTIRQPDHPEGHPELECSIADPVWILSPVFGVELKYYDGSLTPRTLAACELAHAVGDTIEDVVDQGVNSMLHVGTYNCRTIGGTSEISRHGYADAIDIYGFEFDDGRVWTLVDHWEHDTASPATDAGQFLYEAAYRWYEDYIWNIILTPNYNVAHDNHFHVDLSPGSHFVGVTDGRFIGPAPYAD